MSERPFVIAEAGVNHNGSVDLACSLVDAAAEAGADAVKFQTFRADKVATAAAPKAAYQVASTGDADSQLDMIRRLELSMDDFRALAGRAAERGIRFLSTPADPESVVFLIDDLDVSPLKIASGEVTNAPLLLAAARTDRPIVFSTGMSRLDEVAEALGVLAFGYLGGTTPSRAAFAAALASPEGSALVRERVTLLHCTTEYPAAIEDVNLRAMTTLRDTFGVSVGYSDHTPGITVALAAAALGASVIEKHVTLDRSLPGPDHAASLEPAELAELVRSVRMVAAALGSPAKEPAAGERKNIPIARRSLVAARPIRRGEILDESTLVAKRPGTGVSPMALWDVVGRPAARDYSADEPIDAFED